MELRVAAALGDFAGQWDGLAAGSARSTAFLRSWWLSNMDSGDPLYVLIVAGSSLVGGAALQENRWHGLPLVGLRGSGPLEPDHLDVVAAPGMHGAVADLVLDWLVRPGNRVVDLEGLDRDSHITGALNRRGLPVAGLSVAPHACLAGGVPAYLAGRPTSLRRDLRRAERTMAKHGNVFRMSPDVPESLNALLTLHFQQWGQASGVRLARGSLERAVAAGARLGEVAIGEVLSPAGEVLAAQVVLRSGPRLEHYQGGRRDSPEARGAGTWLLWNLLLAHPDAEELDLLRGAEEYKDRWKTGQRPLVRSRFGIGPLAQMLVRASNVRAQVASRVEARRRSR